MATFCKFQWMQVPSTHCPRFVLSDKEKRQRRSIVLNSCMIKLIISSSHCGQGVSWLHGLVPFPSPLLLPVVLLGWNKIILGTGQEGASAQEIHYDVTSILVTHAEGQRQRCNPFLQPFPSDPCCWVSVEDCYGHGHEQLPWVNWSSLLPLPKHSHPVLAVSATDSANTPQPVATNFTILVPFCTSPDPDEPVKQLCLLLPHYHQTVCTTEIKEVSFAPSNGSISINCKKELFQFIKVLLYSQMRNVTNSL